MAPRESTMAAHHRHVEQMVAGYHAHTQRPCLTVFFHAYFDEAGKFHDQEGHICLCGFVSDGDHWNRFESEWQELLKKHSLPKVHMAQFYSQGRLLGWSDENAATVLTEFVDKI